MTQSLARAIAEDRRPPPAPLGAARTPVRIWREEEAIGAQRVTAFVAVLRTRGCYWADVKGCTMCGYARDTLGRSATPEELAAQASALARAYRGEPYVKLYTSGSFWDEREVDAESGRRLLGVFAGAARRLTIETLPEFVSEERIAEMREAFPGELEVSLGLESTDPTVLRRFVNKGTPPEAYLAAGDRLRARGCRAKAYLLLKPPYLTEEEAIRDTLGSIAEAAPHFDTLSVNPVHIQGGTVVEHLYHRRRYRPPWLWSLVEVLDRGARLCGSARLVSFPTAGGTVRGTHNCGRCDSGVLDAIRAASLDQSFDDLGRLDCACRSAWAADRWTEPIAGEP